VDRDHQLARRIWVRDRRLRHLALAIVVLAHVVLTEGSMNPGIVIAAQRAQEAEAAHWAVFQINATTWLAERSESPDIQDGPQEVVRLRAPDQRAAQAQAAFHCMGAALEAAFAATRGMAQAPRQREVGENGSRAPDDTRIPTADLPTSNGLDQDEMEEPSPSARPKGKRYASKHMTPERPEPKEFE
jgi:hypothetical protein